MPPERVGRSVRLWAVSGAGRRSDGPVVGGLLTLAELAVDLPDQPADRVTAVAVTWKMIPNVRARPSTKMPNRLEA